MKSLREITMDNFHECIGLKVCKEQKEFVASNMYSLAEAKADGVSVPLSIYNDETMVGFIMYNYDVKNKMGWIDRLMIDEKYQHRGYGKYAMKEVINRLKSIEECEYIKTSFEPENKIAKKLYLQLGFNLTDEIVYGELVAILDLKTH